jgi:hypothetical protein
MLSKIKTSFSWLAGAILAVGLTSQMYTSFVNNTEDQAPTAVAENDQDESTDIFSSSDSRVYQISDCVSNTAFYALYAATFDDAESSDKFIVYSYAWQHALKTIGATDGYTDVQLSDINQLTMNEYENAMKSMSSFAEFASMMERKSNSCMALMTSSEEIGAAYILGSNSFNTLQTQPVHFSVMPSPEIFNVSCTQVRTYNTTTDDKLLGNIFFADAELIFDGVEDGFSDHQKEHSNLYYVSEGLNRDMAPTPTYFMIFMNRTFLSDADFTLTIVANNRTSRAAIGTNVDLFISKRQGGQIVSKTNYLDCKRI